MANNMKEAWLVYDGECPVCNNYVHFFRAKESITLYLVDARKESEIMDEITKRQFNIDEGMVLKIDDALYYGSDAMHALALLGTESDILNKINYRLFRSQAVSRIIYPIGKAFRNILLKILRIPKINNLKNQENLE